MGKKTKKKFLYIDVSKVQRQDPKQVLLLPIDLYIYLSLMRYKQVSVCSNEEQNSFIYTFYVTWLLRNKSAPTNLLGRLHLGRHKIVLYYFQEGTIDPNYNGGYTSWLYDDQIQ